MEDTPVTPSVTPPAQPEKAPVTIDEFKRIELKVARIKDVADHPKADKLYVITVDAGDMTRQIVAGIKRGYSKEELIGKYIVLVSNLAPAVLRGVESQGMLLAASDEDTIAVLSPDKPVKPGSRIK
ncbi:MAG TPA: methionine--tRNA ligase subunit beta [Candidatus Omnitrophota bacterium]|nr:methionine--tRNA ligase subunit beta [Candidatus Omnitrophota bacterium]HQJ14861.1 methionine--tRNA ligase subunit beta [Candidatus Omnitrophota bacterium]